MRRATRFWSVSLTALLPPALNLLMMFENCSEIGIIPAKSLYFALNQALNITKMRVGFPPESQKKDVNYPNFLIFSR